MNKDQLEIYRDRSTLVLPELHGLGWCDTVKPRVGGPRQDGLDCFEIGYLHQGAIEWLTEDGLEEASSPSLFIDWPGDWQGGLNAIIHPCERYWVRFDLDDLANTPALTSDTVAQLRQRLQSMTRRHFPVTQALHQFFEQILNQQRRPGLFAQELSRAAFHQILFAAVKDHGQDGMHRLSPPIVAALAYIETNFAADFRVDDLARHVGLSCGYLHGLFQRETGMTPARHHLNRRVSAAKNKLIRTDQSVTEIAYHVGFSSSQYFATAFRRVTGISPRDYRLLRSGMTLPKGGRCGGIAPTAHRHAVRRRPVAGNG